MTSVDDQIEHAAAAIYDNIASLGQDRQLLARNILGQLRNLVEGVAVRLHAGRGEDEFQYAAVGDAIKHVGSKGQISFIARFHKLLQASTSHYTLGGDPSERLMLKYYDYLLRIREVVTSRCGLSILSNLEDFPVDLDPSLREYHQQISERISAPVPSDPDAQRSQHRNRYYIHAVRPFQAQGRLYYEVTFYNAVNRVAKFDRMIGFTDIDITDHYAANLTLQEDHIQVLGQTMPITLIRGWEISIRQCEFGNLARVLGQHVTVSTNGSEYRRLMRHLTETSSTLLDVIDMADPAYAEVRTWAIERSRRPTIFPLLDRVRQLDREKAPGRQVLRYLLLQMRNQLIKRQYNPEPCARLSGLHLHYGCIPFDSMPFCTSPVGHNPRLADLVESIDQAGRDHELLARRVNRNVDNRGMLYTPRSDLTAMGDVDQLVGTYNCALYYKHTGRRLLQDKGQVFLKGYEDGTVDIITRLQQLAAAGVAGHTVAVQQWLAQTSSATDDPTKAQALEALFAESRVALIYGAAGTGKSTMVSLISHYLNTRKKLFLAQTNPAVDNLRRRVSAQDSTFRTISSHLARADAICYDVLVVDECSTVGNADLAEVLQRTSFKLLVLVGDVHQIESIQFGNWFALARSFVPPSAVFELRTPFRTTDAGLLRLWTSVREVKEDITEILTRHGYSRVLDQSLFQRRHEDEIVLCLNYDGLYGINNVNRFLQAANPSAATSWGAAVYKVGDPVLFDETDRFRPVIYNNLKGTIAAIATLPGLIRFDIRLDTPVTDFDVEDTELRYVAESTVQFDVYERGSGDEDDDSVSASVPFQVAYAVSIHKSQGLEYNSVKVVVTDANEGDISHNIFYTAITRARENLAIYWTPETEHAVLGQLRRTASRKDAKLLAERRGLVAIP